MNTLKSINESFTKLGNNVLEEAKISPEDKHDSDVIKGIYSKMRYGTGRTNFTPEEKSVMKKYDLTPNEYLDNDGKVKTGYGKSAGLKNSKRSVIDSTNDKNIDKMNIADMARKRKIRKDPTTGSKNQASEYEFNNFYLPDENGKRNRDIRKDIKIRNATKKVDPEKAAKQDAYIKQKLNKRMKKNESLKEDYFSEFELQRDYSDPKKYELASYFNDLIYNALDNCFVDASSKINGLPEPPDEPSSYLSDKRIGDLVDALVAEYYGK